MTDMIPLHQPKWQLDGADWIMIVGNRVVAVLVPYCNPGHSPYWLSRFVGGEEDYPNYGWENVDFETLDGAKSDIEQWWWHMLRGEKYRPP
jgi:hypothetical protein